MFAVAELSLAVVDVHHEQELSLYKTFGGFSAFSCVLSVIALHIPGTCNISNI